MIEKLVWIPTLEDLLIQSKFIKEAITSLGEPKILNLVAVAAQMRMNAYTPYSHYDVGAAILTADGKIFGGCNSEFVAYSPTNHAEGAAIAAANIDGQGRRQKKFIEAVAVCHGGDSGPCGECLQRIIEHTDNCLIIVADPNKEIRRITSLLAIFPYNFNPSHLGQ